MLGISLILPVLNEKKNLEYLIPEFQIILRNNFKSNYEIIIVDDNSKDGTKNLIENLTYKDKNIKYFNRDKFSKNSLPKSILIGINLAKYNLIMWLDADGSMTSGDAENLIKEKLNSDFNVVIGSRFVENGGIKGTGLNTNKLTLLKNILTSSDSIFSILLSTAFNKILKILSKSNIKDQTSGFIILDKECLYGYEDVFMKAFYGDYFIYLIQMLESRNYKIMEVGYYCQIRRFGSSKTLVGSIRFIKLAYFYTKAGLTSFRI